MACEDLRIEDPLHVPYGISQWLPLGIFGVQVSGLVQAKFD